MSEGNTSTTAVLPFYAGDCLEFAINDFCNLRCKYCSQGTPLQHDKMQLTCSQFEHYAGLIKDDEFGKIKLSGGEPTLHKDFGEFVLALPRLFPNREYYLATNGANLEKYLDLLDVFTQISLSFYPTERQPYMQKLYSLVRERTNIAFAIKYNHEGEIPDGLFETNNCTIEISPMDRTDIYPNIGKSGIYERCGFRKVRKVVQDRIYSCCIAFGLCEIRDQINRDAVSIPFNSNWRENLASIDAKMESVACVKCFVDYHAEDQAVAA